MRQYTLEIGHIHSSAGFWAEVPDTGWSELERSKKSVRPGETREGFTEEAAFKR